jgi:hypothetical protein
VLPQQPADDLVTVFPRLARGVDEFGLRGDKERSSFSDFGEVNAPRTNEGRTRTLPAGLAGLLHGRDQERLEARRRAVGLRERVEARLGWEFEDAMASSPDGKYFIARVEAEGSSIFDLYGKTHSGDVAAVRSIPEGAPVAAIWNTYFWVDSADEAVSKLGSNRRRRSYRSDRERQPELVAVHWTRVGSDKLGGGVHRNPL